MGQICLTLIFLALATTRCCLAKDPPFPNIKALSENGFISSIEISGRPENFTAFVEEYYDAANQITKVNILHRGHRQTIILHEKYNQVASIENSTCTVTSFAEANSITNPMFPNWLYSEEGKNEVYYGPTSILRRAADSPPKYTGKGKARGMDCHTFAAPDPSREDINIKYFFTADWTTPVGKAESVMLPVQIEIFGEGIAIEGSSDENFLQYVNYVYFIPAVKDPTVFEPPFGIGCKGLKSDEVKMPAIPQRFTVEGEQFFPSTPSSDLVVSTFRVWYDYNAKLARLDIYGKDDNGVSKVLDYNTGLMYVTRDNEECTSAPISDSYFDEITGDLKLVLKDPDAAMGMKGDFYFLGKKYTRGIYCDIWESVVENYTIDELQLNRIVYTYFVSSRYWEFDIDGEVEEQVPIRLEVNTYVDGIEGAATTRVFNFFHFSKHPPMDYSQFSIEFCASSVPDKKYIMILIETDVDDAKKAAGNAAELKISAQEEIIRIAGISPIRLPFLTVEVEPDSISIVALVLERAPAIVQFEKLFEDTPKSKEKSIGIVKSEELCAEECIKAEVCVGFHYCSVKGECYVSITDWSDDWGEDIKGLNSCVLYERRGAGSYIKDLLLKDALDNLKKTVSDGKFFIEIQAGEDFLKFTGSEFVADFTPVSPGGHDKDMFSKVIGQTKFKLTSQTTRNAGQALSAGICYRKCQKEGNIGCSSFSFCIDTNECLLSSILVLPKKKIDDTQVESSEMCTVYSIDYLQMFEEYEGQIRVSPGKEAITSASASECAKSCREKEDPVCSGFDFCNQKSQCILHEKHVLDIKEGDLTSVGSECSHYALKYIADFYEMVRMVIRDPKAKDVFGVSAENCAKLCSGNMEFKCESFDFCPNDVSGKTKCTLNTVVLDDDNADNSDTCQHYEKRANAVDDFLNSKQVKAVSDSSSGYTPGGLAGVIIGVLILGIAVGIIGFLIYSYVRKTRYSDERSVRFMKQENT